MAMPIAWQAGYNWAYNDNDEDLNDVAERNGYDFGTHEYKMFLAGAHAAQQEQIEEWP